MEERKEDEDKSDEVNNDELTHSSGFFFELLALYPVRFEFIQ